jgi:CHAT domain-containing protein
VTTRGVVLVAGILAALAGWSGCRSSPQPEASYAEAEALRARYKKEATREAIARYDAAVEAWKRRGDLRSAARACWRIGLAHEQLGSLEESLRRHLEAVSLAEQSGDRLLESEVRSDAGIAQAYVADREERFEDARRQCQGALDLARRLGAKAAEAKALNCLGEVAYHLQHPEQALDLYDESGRLWDDLDDARGCAQTLLYRGYVYSDLSRFDAAHACYERARSLWDSLGDRREQAITLVAEARLLGRQGEYQKSANSFAAALALLEPMGDVIWEGSSLVGISRVYLDMGEPRAALQYGERAFGMFETAGLKSIAADVVTYLGETYLASGDDRAALDRFQRVLGLGEELGIQRWQAVALRLIGVVHLVRGEPRLAEPYLERSLALQRSAGTPAEARDEARTLADLGEARGLLGEPDAAARLFGSALSLSRASGDRVAEARALFGLARISAGRGDLAAARDHIEASLKIVESLRSEVDSRDLRASYFASVYRYHEFHVDVLMRLDRSRRGQGLAAAAFEASERARARSLLDSLAEAGVDLRTGVDPDLLRREQMAKGAFDDWARRHEQPVRTKGAEAAAAAEEYRDLERRYDQIEAEIRSGSPRYAALTQPQPLRVPELQKELLDPGTLLLEYALGDERSYLWAVSDRDQASYELPPRQEIEGAAQRAYERLTARLTAMKEAHTSRVEQADADYWREATRLSDVLLGPVARKMAGKRLLVVADGALQYLPFAALPVPGRAGDPVPMIVEHEVVSLPSASVVAVLRRETKGRKPPAKAVAVLADPVFERDDPRLRAVSRDGRSAGRDPDAPAGGRAAGPGYPRLAATAQEASAIVGLVPEGSALRAVGFDASRATAMSPDLARYRIVHFATHGVFDDENPGLSGVVLSMFGERGQPQDGVLRLHDIYGLHLPAELVVLSACGTGLGKPVRGEGLVGIVRGFMYAGAKRVVASLWKVDDDATGEMMGRFYREMLEGNRSPAVALRAAQIGMWRQERWRSPYYWAAFVLQGEWR